MSVGVAGSLIAKELKFEKEGYELNKLTQSAKNIHLDLYLADNNYNIGNSIEISLSKNLNLKFSTSSRSYVVI